MDGYAVLCGLAVQRIRAFPIPFPRVGLHIPPCNRGANIPHSLATDLLHVPTGVWVGRVRGETDTRSEAGRGPRGALGCFLRLDIATL